MVGLKGLLSLGGHQLVDVRDRGDVGGDVGVIREEACVAVRGVGVVAVHRADGAFAHVARNTQYAFVGEKD